jgi:hypothetical protein
VAVNHIMVKPGGRLSLQMHHHRAQHWVVVQGTAKILRGEQEMILTEDQSTYIPVGIAHRLEVQAESHCILSKYNPEATWEKMTSSVLRIVTGEPKYEIRSPARRDHGYLIRFKSFNHDRASNINRVREFHI